jgi:hypothetical protein
MEAGVAPLWTSNDTVPNVTLGATSPCPNRRDPLIVIVFRTLSTRTAVMMGATVSAEAVAVNVSAAAAIARAERVRSLVLSGSMRRFSYGIAKLKL